MHEPKLPGCNSDFFECDIHQEISVDPIKAPHEERKIHIFKGKHVANPYKSDGVADKRDPNAQEDFSENLHI
jgi:hypothetical protein